MKLLAITLIGLLFSSSATTSAFAWDCNEERRIERDFDIGVLKNIRVKAGAGNLSIKGTDQSDSVGIVAKLCASDERVLAQMDVLTAINGDVASIETKFPDRSGGRYSAAIDLSLTVPKGVDLDVVDSSGDLEISDVASLVLIDSSGDVDINNIDGNVDLKDSSGEVRLENVGTATVVDSSGDLEIERIRGDLIIDVDSSGDIEVRDAGANVLVRVDSSGSIDVEDVEGGFTVEKDGSGKIRFENVKGDVIIPESKRK